MQIVGRNLCTASWHTPWRRVASFLVRRAHTKRAAAPKIRADSRWNNERLLGRAFHRRAFIAKHGVRRNKISIFIAFLTDLLSNAEEEPPETDTEEKRRVSCKHIQTSVNVKFFVAVVKREEKIILANVCLIWPSFQVTTVLTLYQLPLTLYFASVVKNFLCKVCSRQLARKLSAAWFPCVHERSVR